ncbi:hypothetical protein NKJ73_32655, partial [Mesorhizobium sp. M0074]|uniref:hypothetical protein n=1 Tax=Mesorhizobium sp. M0074 TaxID=2956869 RepID=UPI00333A7681
HATHEERPLFAVRTPIVNPAASGFPLCSFRAAMPGMSADPAQDRGPLSSAELMLQQYSLADQHEFAVSNPSS